MNETIHFLSQRGPAVLFTSVAAEQNTQHQWRAPGSTEGREGWEGWIDNHSNLQHLSGGASYDTVQNSHRLKRSLAWKTETGMTITCISRAMAIPPQAAPQRWLLNVERGRLDLPRQDERHQWQILGILVHFENRDRAAQGIR